MKFKNRISLILAVSMIFGTIDTVSAHTDDNIYKTVNREDVVAMAADSVAVYPVEGGNIYFDKSTGAVISADFNITSADIPDTVEGIKVTSIEAGAFEYCSGLKSVKIPESVTSIGDYAFMVCGSLTSVTQPDNLTYLGESVFGYNDALTGVYASPNSSNFSDIDGILFNKEKNEIWCYPGGKQDAEYTIPDGVTSIKAGAFLFCRNLTSINMPHSLTSIEGGAFEFCDGLTTVTIPDNVTTIENQVFAACKALTGIYVSEGNKYYTDIDGILFNKEKNEIWYYPNGRTDTEYTIPDNITSIKNSAFMGSGNLKTINISNNVTRIEENAFDGCSGLTTITIPDSVEFIGGMAFNACNALTDVYVSEGNKNYTDIDGVLFSKDKTEILCCPVGRKDTEYTIPEGVTTVKYGAFAFCTGLVSIHIPKSVRSIDKSACTMCINLADVYYDGSEEEWNSLNIDDNNVELLNANIHYNDVINYGDADCDGTLNAADAAMVLQKVLKDTFKMTVEEKAGDYMSVADVNRDNDLTSEDAAMILQKVLKSTFKMTCEL